MTGELHRGDAVAGIGGHAHRLGCGRVVKCRNPLRGLPCVMDVVSVEIFDREETDDGRDVVGVGSPFVENGPALRTIDVAVAGITGDLAVGRAKAR